MTRSPPHPEPAAAAVPNSGRAVRFSGAKRAPQRRTGLIGRMTIRGRLNLMSSALLIILVATNLYLTRKIMSNCAGMVETAELLKTIEQATNAQITLDKDRYWLQDLTDSMF